MVVPHSANYSTWIFERFRSASFFPRIQARSSRCISTGKCQCSRAGVSQSISRKNNSQCRDSGRRNDASRTSFIAETISVGGTPSFPEPSRLEPKWLDRAAVQKRLRGRRRFRARDLAVGSLKFPSASKQTVPGSFGVVLRWREADVDRWEAKVREHHELLRSGRLFARARGGVPLGRIPRLLSAWYRALFRN
jgi:hypothetical protein